jgi:AI-2 transport protein TqsA
MAKREGQYEQRIQTGCLLILTALGGAGALYVFRSVLIPFVLAVFLTLCLTPVIDLQVERLRINRYVAVLTTIFMGVVVLGLGALLVTAAANEIARSKKDYQEQVRKTLARAQRFIPPDWHTSDPNDPSQPLIAVPAQTARKVLTQIVSDIMTIVSNGLLVVIFMIFMVAKTGMSRAPTGSVLSEIESRIKRYILTMISTSGITGLLVGISLTILGVRFGWMFGFLAFLLNFIPSIGSIIATILPLPIALLDPELGLVAKILVLAIPGTIQFCIGNLLQPKLMGQSLNLHPVTVLLSLMFFGVIWGVTGMLLATPITAVVSFLLERSGYTRPVANLLAGNLDVLMKQVETSPAVRTQQLEDPKEDVEKRL